MGTNQAPMPNKPETTFIYGLVDPRRGEVRYVGKSDHPAVRLLAHLGSKIHNRSGTWIRALVKLGLKPQLVILAEVKQADWQEAERKWIAHFAAQGNALTNAHPGGTGGNLLSAEGQARRIAATVAATKGKALSPEHREKLRQAKLGKKHSPEHVEKQRLATLKRYEDPEERRKTAEHSRQRKGIPLSAAGKEAVRLAGIARRGRPVSEETRAKLREAKAKFFSDPENRKVMARTFTDESRKKLSESGTKAWKTRERKTVEVIDGTDLFRSSFVKE